MVQTNKLIAKTYDQLIGPGPEVSDSPSQLAGFISSVIGFLTIIAIIFFVIQIILAGYNFISGQGDEKKIEIARKKLTDGVLGITIVVVAFGLGAFISKLLGLGDNVFDLSNLINNLQQ